MKPRAGLASTVPGTSSPEHGESFAGRFTLTTRAYLLLETAVGKTREVATQLRGVDNMKTVDVVTGPYDIIALIEAEDINSIGDIVTSEIHIIPGVVRSVTCVAVGSS
jgi:DNA-binding Lrp family transcriptional regulator